MYILTNTITARRYFGNTHLAVYHTVTFVLFRQGISAECEHRFKTKGNKTKTEQNVYFSMTCTV